MLDIEVAGSIAPAARMAVYFAPNTSDGFVRAVAAAIYDKQNQPAAISVSWGGAENVVDVSAQCHGSVLHGCCLPGNNGAGGRWRRRVS